MIKAMFSVLTLALCGLSFNSHAQEFANDNKNTVFIGVSIFHYDGVPGFQISEYWWLFPNVTYQRLITPNSKLSFAFVNFQYDYVVKDFYQINIRSSIGSSIQYGHEIIDIGNFSVYLNGGIALRRLHESWFVTLIDRPGWTEWITDSYNGWGVGAAFRLDIHYTIKDRININPHVDYQYYFDGRARQFFVGLLVGYNFGK